MIFVLLSIIAFMFGLGTAAQVFGYYLLIRIVIGVLAAALDA